MLVQQLFWPNSNIVSDPHYERKTYPSGPKVALSESSLSSSQSFPVRTRATGGPIINAGGQVGAILSSSSSRSR